MDQNWHAIFEMIDHLSPAGMSSDESDRGASGQRIYLVKKRAWRSSALVQYLNLVDNDRNTTNGYGNTRSGNPPRTRIRRSGNPTVSERGAVPGLPLNFYDKTWYSVLSRRDKRDLGAKEEMMLPELEDD